MEFSDDDEPRHVEKAASALDDVPMALRKKGQEKETELMHYGHSRNANRSLSPSCPSIKLHNGLGITCKR